MLISDLKVRFLVCSMLISSLLPFPLFAQQKKDFTLDDIWKKPVWRGESVEDVNWFSSGSQYSVLESGNIEVYDIQTGKRLRTLLEGTRLKNQSGQIDIQNYTLSPDESMVLIESDAEPIYRRSSRAYFHLYNLKTDKLQAVMAGKKISLASFSPDGKWIAFTFENNLYLYEIASGVEKAITTTGRINEIIHGSSDWVYEEEFEFWKAFHWSPDSKKIAFMTFDERQVPSYNMQMWTGLYPEDNRFKYPKAGEKNSRVDVSVFELSSGRILEINEGAENDQYIARMQWTRNPGLLSLRRLNRLQNTMELLHVDADNGSVQVVLTEKSSTFHEMNDDLRYLKNGKEFIWSSDRSGFQHLYLYGMDGKEIRPITSGDWEVTSFQGIDEKPGLLYYLSTENGSTQRQLYAISVSGKNKRKLTTGSGTHSIRFNPDFTVYMDDYSSAGSAPVTSLHQANGKQIKMLEENKALTERLGSYRICPKEFFEITTEKNIKLNAWIIKPADFEPSKKYPVLMHCYGGPGHQTVTDAWGGADFFWYQLLASKGYVIVSVDNRGTGGKGSEFRKCTYAQLGKFECEDQTDAARWIGRQAWADPARIGIWGWSFGGFLTSLCMTKGADVFKTGIAVAPVTNWRFYDSIYTERYLKLPQENASGYDDNSPVNYADKLKGNYLIVHGTGDDNVHFQNAVTMVNALVKANKPFDSAYYPNRNHGIYGGTTRLHLYEKMTRFILEKL